MINLFFQPLEQFEIIVVKYFNFGLFMLLLTNSLLTLLLVFLMFLFVFHVGLLTITFVPTGLQKVLEDLYAFV
jgi:hypothetical protein